MMLSLCLGDLRREESLFLLKQNIHFLKKMNLMVVTHSFFSAAILFFSAAIYSVFEISIGICVCGAEHVGLDMLVSNRFPLLYV